MRRILSMTCMATICSVGALMAQSEPTMKPQSHKAMKDGTVMVTGCVAEGATTGQFTLTNAMMAHGKDTMGRDTMAKDPMAKDKAAGDHKTSYTLVGGTDLKAHLGHKVEVTGTMDKTNQMGQSSDREPMEKEKMTGTSGRDMKAGTLNVTGVKMLSATCP